ncbi:hypothetical protein ACLB2K_066424 [Fragaria x ananassa]
MQASIEDMQYLQFPLPPVPFMNPYLGTMQYCYYPVIPFPMHDPDPVPAPDVIYQVWNSNLTHEFKRIWNLISQGGRLFASIDTEYPGTLYKSDKGRLDDPDYMYHLMRKNVNETNIIQLGLTLADLHGNRYTWEFNFSDFDIVHDRQDKDSVDFLMRQGVDFRKHKKDGIPSHEFARKCLEAGLLGNKLVVWVGFQILYDLGYFTKILTGKNLPDKFDTYMEFERDYFGDRVYDVKDMIREYNRSDSSRDSNPKLHGGLDKVAETLGIPRVAGKSHQAGSDSLLTYLTFLKLNDICNGEDVLGVADEVASGEDDIPEAEFVVPGVGESKLAVVGEDDILDKLGVAGEAAARDEREMGL